MRISVGCDVMLIKKAEVLVDKGHLERILRPEEINRSDAEHIAGRIALKEAAIKALGLTANDWLKLRIRSKGGKPMIDLIEPDETIESLDCSISHDGEYAFAVVTVLYREA